MKSGVGTPGGTTALRSVTVRSASGAVRERGSAIVEFALIAPLLIMLVLGAVESAWILAQNVDVRHAAREGARLAAVDFGDRSAIGAAVCASMDDSTGTTIALAGDAAALGGDVQVTATRSPSHLTTLLAWAFPDTMTLGSTATFSLEVSPPTWTDGTYSC